MGMEDFFASLPTGKEDKPLLFGIGPLTYDFHDVDGLYYMLDRRLSGCMIMMWSKQMNPEIRGKVTLDGKEIRGSVLTSMQQMNYMWILGIPLRGHIAECGKEYALHVEGYEDTDGNQMNPQDFVIQSAAWTDAEEKYAGHEQIAYQAAVEGTVLLENKNHVLPLKEGTVCNLFGKGIHQFRNGAVGAGKINPRYSRNLAEALRMSDVFTLNEELVEFYSCDEDEIPPEHIMENAKKASDTAIMLITRAAGENMDNSTAKGEYYLSDKEEALIQTLSQEFAHVVVILNVGYPISMSFVKKYGIEAVLYTGFGGMLGGPAVVDLLSGRQYPSGKLPDTWAEDYFDIPASRNFYDCVDKPRLDAEQDVYVDTVYEEDIYVGYRYFDTFGKPVAYPFGYGLSYTEFSMKTEEVDFDGENLSLKVIVKNTGDRAGREVVQVYAGKPEVELEKPKKELVFFEKTKELLPDEEQKMEIVIPKAHLSSYSEKDAAYILEKGEYLVYVGNSVEADACGSFTLSEKQITRQAVNRMVPQTAFTRLSKYNSESYPTGKPSGVKEEKHTFEPYAPREKFKAEFKGEKPSEKLTFADVREDLSKAEAYVAQFSLEELARISVCAQAGWGMEGVGEAGSMYQMEGFDIPRFPVSDGNCGVNLRIPNIGMPSSVTVCATFNKQLAEQAGRVIGEEAKELGMPMILAPAMNIHRNPLNGRQPEYFSEDPYLAGVMSGCFSRGLENAGVGACIKHLIANNCESSRKRNQSIVSERALREIYFKAFEYSMEEHMPAAVMTAYNACNGQPASTDAELILGMLREECGFDGFVMTDWTSYDTADVACMIEAGNCWITPGSTDDTFTSRIIAGVNEGRIQLARLQQNVVSMIRTMARFS
ncbi:hypothetical protein B5F07_12175 [Lachnoclostridium sp. An169]|mgnify:CR=1 FL=1|uniref:glycoside hydrolase family 3 protein n=1 Tax=Lachnoclostridium sp. An169 TaxID=1965569 RepID=UPI000B36CB53|nr:glycoside hydrolase family 3 protein [Lachnoclostridium sp. An169]OUP82922.1 hypothetical protein B5F07_12175 [Lachnoclostridium sp. An169]